jgi:hypothetical protein
MQPEVPAGRPLTAAEMGLMQGSPPPADKRVTLAQWQGPPWNRWAYQQMSQIIPTARIWRGHGRVAPLAAEPVEVDDICFETVGGERTTVGALLQRTYTDGFLVLRDGRIASEQYFNGMQPHTRHLLHSVSKSITGALAGALAGHGLLDPEAQLEAYVPELRRTSFSGATVRHLLDMSAGTRFSEDYDDPQSDIRLYEGAAGWRPAAPHEQALDLFGYILTLPNARPHGGLFDYRSILTDLLGIVLERAAGMRFADAMSEMVWAPIGPKHDAEITVDRVGSPMTDGGICVTLRDLARFGQMYLRRGLAEGRQVVPAAWVDDTRYADETCKRAFAASETAIRYPKGHYRNQWWVPDDEAGVILGSGIHGQSLYVHLGRDVVIAKLSSLPIAFDADIYADQYRAYTAIAETLHDRASADRAGGAESVQLRIATSADADTVARLVRTLMNELGFLSFDERGLPDVFARLGGPDRPDFVMLAERHGAVIGICSLSAMLSLRTKGLCGVVQEMYVAPGHRCKGIGERLLTAAVDHAEALGFAMVEVGTPPDGERQGRFYQRSGFTRFGDRWRCTLAHTFAAVPETLHDE